MKLFVYLYAVVSALVSLVTPIPSKKKGFKGKFFLPFEYLKNTKLEVLIKNNWSNHPIDYDKIIFNLANIARVYEEYYRILPHLSVTEVGVDEMNNIVEITKKIHGWQIGIILFKMLTGSDYYTYDELVKFLSQHELDASAYSLPEVNVKKHNYKNPFSEREQLRQLMKEFFDEKLKELSSSSEFEDYRKEILSKTLVFKPSNRWNPQEILHHIKNHMELAKLWKEK